MSDIKHPMQPVIVADDGIHRFKANAIVQHLLDNGGIDLNKLAILDFTDDDRAQFLQLIGYSVSGTTNMDCITDELYFDAMAQSEAITEAEK